MPNIRNYGTGNELAALSGSGTADSPFVPQVSAGSGSVVDLTLSLDTNAYADGDVLADTQELASAVRVSGGRCYLHSLHVLDEDDQGGAFDVIFLNANTSLGTENSAPNVSDANARSIIGRVSVSSSDYYDLGGCRIATKTGIGLMLQASGSTSLYAAVISRDSKTYTASGIRLKLGFLWD